jgi:radical SAM protein with 4Fe4S-binding SPASM domain
MAYLRLIVSSVCNLSCSFCHIYNISKFTQSKPFMSYEEMIHYLNTYIGIMKKNNDNILNISISGGEPLLNKKSLFRFISEVGNCYKEISISWIINTNGSLISEDDTLFFNKYNIDIHISCYGYQRIYDINRMDKNGRGKFKKITKSLTLLKKYDVKSQINYFITSDNINNLRNIIDIALVYDIDRIYLDWDYNNHDKINSRFVVERFMDVYVYAKQKEIIIDGPWSTPFNKLINKKTNIKRTKITNNIEINTDSSFLFINYPLIRNKKYSFNKINEYFSTKENFNNILLQKKRIENICKSCKFKDYCNGKAIHQFQYYKNKEEGYTYYCSLMKKILSGLIKYFFTKEKKTVQVNISYECNKTCSYCYAKPLMLKYKDMTIDDFKILCRWLVRNYVQSINITGGEPTICKKLPIFLKVAKRFGIRVTLFSNGLFNTNLIPSLKENIEGFLINYNNITHYTEKEWNLLHKNLDVLHKERFFFRFMFNIPEHISSCEYAIKICKKYGIKKALIDATVPNSLKTNTYISSNDLKKNSKKIVIFMKKFLKNGIVPKFSRPMPPCIFKDEEEFLKKIDFKMTTCKVGNSVISINPDLTVFPCLSLFIKGPRINSFKNFNEYKEFYKESISHLKWKKILFPECENCMHYHKKECQGSCVCRKGKGFSFFNNEKFVIYSQYNKNEKDIFIASVKNTIDRIEQYLSINKKIEIYNFDNKKDFLIYSKGFSYPDSITSLVRNGTYYQYGTRINKKRLTHSLVHCVLKNFFSYKTPIWVSEGICEYIASGEETISKIKIFLKHKKLIPFSEISETYKMSILAIDYSSLDNNLLYQQAGNMIGYILKKFSMNILLKILSDPCNDFYISFRKNTGKDFFDIEKQWIKELKI